MSSQRKLKAHGLPFVVRMRGLPFAATPEEVVEFLSGVEVSLPHVHLINGRDGRPSGEAFVELRTEVDCKRALAKHKEHMGARYVEMFRSSPPELVELLANRTGRSGKEKAGSNGNANANANGAVAGAAVPTPVMLPQSPSQSPSQPVGAPDCLPGTSPPRHQPQHQPQPQPSPHQPSPHQPPPHQPSPHQAQQYSQSSPQPMPQPLPQPYQLGGNFHGSPQHASPQHTSPIHQHQQHQQHQHHQHHFQYQHPGNSPYHTPSSPVRGGVPCIPPLADDMAAPLPPVSPLLSSPVSSPPLKPTSPSFSPAVGAHRGNGVRSTPELGGRSPILGALLDSQSQHRHHHQQHQQQHQQHQHQHQHVAHFHPSLGPHPAHHHGASPMPSSGMSPGLSPLVSAASPVPAFGVELTPSMFSSLRGAGDAGEQLGHAAAPFGVLAPLGALGNYDAAQRTMQMQQQFESQAQQPGSVFGAGVGLGVGLGREGLDNGGSAPPQFAAQAQGGGAMGANEEGGAFSTASMAHALAGVPVDQGFSNGNEQHGGMGGGAFGLSAGGIPSPILSSVSPLHPLSPHHSPHAGPAPAQAFHPAPQQVTHQQHQQHQPQPQHQPEPLAQEPPWQFPHGGQQESGGAAMGVGAQQGAKGAAWNMVAARGARQQQQPPPPQQQQPHQPSLLGSNGGGESGGSGNAGASANGGQGVGAKSQQSNSKGPVTVKLRGLPFSASPKDVLDFLRGTDVMENSVHMGTNKDGRPSGEAWVTYSSLRAAQRAVEQRNNEHLGSRYIELFIHE